MINSASPVRGKPDSDTTSNYEKNWEVSYAIYLCSIFLRRCCPDACFPDMGLTWEDAMIFLGLPSESVGKLRSDPLLIFRLFPGQQADRVSNSAGKPNHTLDPEGLGGPQVWLLCCPLFSNVSHLILLPAVCCCTILGTVPLLAPVFTAEQSLAFACRKCQNRLGRSVVPFPLM